MDRNNHPTETGVQNADGPLTALMLLAIAHHGEDAAELLKPLGVSQFHLDKFTVENAEMIETVRKMVITGALLDRDTFARLIRVRVGVKLLETEDPRKLAPLVTAAAKLPPWVFGEADPSAKQQKNKAKPNGVYLDSEDNLPDISAMGMQEALAEAKELIAELEKPARVKVL